MSNPQPLQLRVGVEVGSRCHGVAVGLTGGGGVSLMRTRLESAGQGVTSGGQQPPLGQGG